MMNGHPMMSNKKQTTTESPIYYPTGNYIRNPLFDDSIPSQKPVDSYALDMDTSYDRNYEEPQNHLPSSTNLNLQFLQPPPIEQEKPTYLSGPMVIRVHPDGRPVIEDTYKPLPRDDDRDEMTIGRDRLPTMQELATSSGSIQSPSHRYSVAVPPPQPPPSQVTPQNRIGQAVRPQFSFRLGQQQNLSQKRSIHHNSY